MGIKIMAFAITGVIAAAGLQAQAQEIGKTAKAPKTLLAVVPHLNEVKVDSAADFLRFKKESEQRINENMSKLVELKAKTSRDREEQRVIDKRVFALEMKNNILKKKIRNAGETTTSRWVSFKKSFNHDMQELQATLKSL